MLSRKPSAVTLADPRVRLLAASRAMRAVASRRRPSSPAELAALLIPGYRITPSVAMIAAAVAEAVTTPDARLIISTPPRESKSTTVAVAATLWALQRDPSARIILATYADTLSEEHSRAARALINEHHDYLGFAVAQDKSSVGRWAVEGRQGGLLAAGILSGITGFGADLLICDDVHKNAQDSDSDATRNRVIHEFRSTLMTRLMPGGSAIIIGTRWHPRDLIGTLLDEEPERWRHISIPAISEAGIPDSLCRPSGVAMTSAVGRTTEQFEDIKASVGQRVWYALFQGVPASPEGGLVLKSWLDDWRLPCAPAHPTYTVVGVDPSDSGSGDSCGLVAASMTADGVVAVIADCSKPMTSDEWARAAVQLALDVGASEIAVEAFAARETYSRVLREALNRARPDRHIRITAWPPLGSGRGKGDSVGRAAALLQALEVGTCRMAGQLPELEAQAISWQQGQHQPDSLAALVVAHDVLVHSAGMTMTFGIPGVDGLSSGAAASVTSLRSYLSQKVM